MVYIFGGEKKKAVLLTIQCESPNLSGRGAVPAPLGKQTPCPCLIISCFITCLFLSIFLRAVVVPLLPLPFPFPPPPPPVFHVTVYLSSAMSFLSASCFPPFLLFSKNSLSPLQIGVPFPTPPLPSFHKPMHTHPAPWCMYAMRCTAGCGTSNSREVGWAIESTNSLSAHMDCALLLVFSIRKLST